MSTTENLKYYPSISQLLPLIILLEGFVSIAIEILTIRQLLPVAGGSVIVTSLIIGIFLLFLALGYQYGGRTLNNAKQILSRNFFISALWLGVGLSYFFVGLFFYSIQQFSGPHIVYPLITYLLFIIAPLIFILGQTLPITMNMVKQNYPAGKIGGNTLGLSTLGSFLGAIVTTLVFMYYLGIAWTIVINFLILLTLSLLLTDRNLFLNLIIGVMSLLIVYNFNIKVETLFFDLTDNYANYKIETDKNTRLKSGEKVLVINDTNSSFINAEKKGYPYAEMIRKILFTDLKLTHANILVLGAGGFSISAAGTHDNHFIYVDIDSNIKKVTVPHFVPELKSDLIIDDARHFLNSTSNNYDVIILDAYSDIKSVPSHLITKEYIRTVKYRLTNHGIAIFNIIAKPTLTDPYSKRIDNTIRSVFANCMSTPVSYHNLPTNILYLCNNSLNENDKQIYSDNNNNSTTDSFSW